MRINLRYQIILFSSFELEATPEVLSTIKDSLNEEELVVTPMLEAIIGVGPNGATSVGRPRFASNDGSFSFYVKSDCAAFEWVNVNIGVTDVMPFDTFCKKVTDICDKVSYLQNHQYRRIGMIRTTFIDEVNQQDVFGYFNNTIKYFKGKEMKDWNCFIPAQAVICGNVEANATSRIQHISTKVNKDSSTQKFDGISLTTDVNTTALNTVDKYSLNEIKQFVAELKEIEYQITNDSYNVIVNGNN